MERFYFDTLLLAWAFTLYFGIYFIFGKVPKKEIFSLYERSRKVLGIGLIIYGVHMFLQWKLNFRTNAPHLATALNLSCLYIEAIIFGMSLISLLDGKYINGRQIRRDFIAWGIWEVIVWSTVFSLDGTLRSIILIIAAIWFFLEALRISILFFKTYNRAIKKMQEYYSEEIEIFIKWMLKSVYGVVFYGLFGAVQAFGSKGVIGVYTFVGIFLLGYIFSCFINYLVNYEEVERAIKEEDSLNKGINYSISNNKVEANIKKWIANNGYTQSGVNIEQVALLTHTNRTYLSSHIKRTYCCSFREWIAKLRIEQVKKLLLEEEFCTIVSIADRMGFNSASQLTHTFTLYENISPKKWREENKPQKLA